MSHAVPTATGEPLVVLAPRTAGPILGEGAVPAAPDAAEPVATLVP